MAQILKISSAYTPPPPKGFVSPMTWGVIQVAVLSWAATQVPEITVAIQSFLKAGFRSAVQVELLFMIGGLHLVTKAARSPSFRNFVPEHALIR